MIKPSEIAREIEAAVPVIGRAGSMSFHHVRALHGSALNTSNRSRNLLLYEVAAADAWSLLGVADFDEFNSRLLSGRRSWSRASRRFLCACRCRRRRDRDRSTKIKPARPRHISRKPLRRRQLAAVAGRRQ
jgi:hypothetical protein